MKKDSEKYEDIELYELDALKEIMEKLFERNGESERQSYVVKGIASGLIYGVFGVLFIQFLYPIVKALLLGEYSSAFVGNLIVCAISIISIVLVSLYLHRYIARVNSRLKISKESIDVIEYAIKRHQYALAERERRTAIR